MMTGVDSVPVGLEGRFVRLEPLAQSHLDGLCAAGLEGDVFRWFQTVVTDRAGMAAFVAGALDQQRAGQSVPFATIERSTGLVVGSTRFCAIERSHRRLEIGWTWLGRRWQRTALNTEAKLLMLAHAFEVWGCRRVEFKTDRLNQASRSALARLGAVEEGTFRQHMVCTGGRSRDSVWFSIIDSDWPVVRERLAARVGRDG